MREYVLGLVIDLKLLGEVDVEAFELVHFLLVADWFDLLLFFINQIFLVQIQRVYYRLQGLVAVSVRQLQAGS